MAAKRIKEREWDVHVRPHDQPAARVATVYIADGGTSYDPSAFAKVLGRGVEQAIEASAAHWGELFAQELKAGRVRVEVVPVNPAKPKRRR